MSLRRWLFLSLSSLAWANEEIHGPPSPAEISEMSDCLSVIPADGLKELNKLKNRLNGIEGLARPTTAEQYTSQASAFVKDALEEMSLRSRISIYAQYKIEADGLGDKFRQKIFPFKMSRQAVASDYCSYAHLELSTNPKILEGTLVKEIAERAKEIKTKPTAPKLSDAPFWSTAEWPLYNLAPSIDPKEEPRLKYLKAFYEKHYGAKSQVVSFESKFSPTTPKKEVYGSAYYMTSQNPELPDAFSTSERAAVLMMLEKEKIRDALQKKERFPQLEPYREILISGLKKLPPYVGPANSGALMKEKELEQYQPGKVVETKDLKAVYVDSWGQDSFHRFRIFSKTGRRPTNTSPLFILPGTKFKVLYRDTKADGTVEIAMEEQ